MVETPDDIAFAWYGTDHVNYFSVSRRDAEAAYPAAVARQVDRLLQYLAKEPRGQYAERHWRELAALTGREAGGDPAEWQAWWEAERDGFKPAGDAYVRVVQVHIDWEREWTGVSATEHRLAEGADDFRAFMWRQWLQRLLLTLAFPLGLACLLGWLLHLAGPRPTP